MVDSMQRDSISGCQKTVSEAKVCLATIIQCPTYSVTFAPVHRIAITELLPQVQTQGGEPTSRPRANNG